MTWRIALSLGRISNLPTVWTNMLAGIVLAGGVVADARTAILLVALSLFYTGGMYLNDAYDADIDAVQRPERPIPSGQIGRRTVFVLGFAMLAAGTAILLWTGLGRADGTGIWPAVAGLALAAAIIVYDRRHKGFALSPVVMGLCRLLVYITAGLVFVVPLPAGLIIGAVLLLSYVIGLTYVAKQETLGKVENLWPLLFLVAPLLYGLNLAVDQPIAGVFWLAFALWMGVALWLIKRRGPGDVPRAVVSLIAGISLFDAVLIAGTGAFDLALVAVLGFALTLALQRYIAGT